MIGPPSPQTGVQAQPADGHPQSVPGDKLIADRRGRQHGQALRLHTRPSTHAAIRERATVPAPPERILIMGWNDHAAAIINELDNYVAPGSLITVSSRPAPHATG